MVEESERRAEPFEESHVVGKAVRTGRRCVPGTSPVQFQRGGNMRCTEVLNTSKLKGRSIHAMALIVASVRSERKSLDIGTALQYGGSSRVFISNPTLLSIVVHSVKIAGIYYVL
jgi:hypothetical protein